MPYRSEVTSDAVVVRGVGPTVPGLSRHRIRAGLHHLPFEFAAKHASLFDIPPKLLGLARRPPSSSGDRPSSIPDSMWSRMYLYQRDTVSCVVHRFKGRCLLAHDMGLGKTVQAIALMHHYGSPVLVMCPAFLRDNWVASLSEWGPGLDVTVLSYDSIRSSAAAGAQEWSLVIADESHYLKQREAQRTQAALPIIMSCEHAVLLSGTPCPNRPEELFVPMHALRPSIVPSFTWFGRRYCNARRTRFSAFDTSGSSRSQELSWLLRRAFMLRLRKQDVLGDLPQKLTSVHRVTSGSQAALVRLAELSEEMEDASPVRLKCLISEMFRATCEAKQASVVEYVVSRARQRPVLAFAHHRSMLDALEAGGHSAKLSVLRMDGDTPMAERQAMVDRIQQQSDVDLACFSMATAGVGFTLTKMSRVMFAELPWNPAVLRQCEDRVYRIGQQNTCIIEYLLCDGTLDDHVWKRCMDKEKIINKSV